MGVFECKQISFARNQQYWKIAKRFLMLLNKKNIDMVPCGQVILFKPLPFIYIRYAKGAKFSKCANFS